MYLGRDGFYGPRQNRWNPGDGSNKNVGNTRLFFRRIIVGEDYEIPIDDVDDRALRERTLRD